MDNVYASPKTPKRRTVKPIKEYFRILKSKLKVNVQNDAS